MKYLKTYKNYLAEALLPSQFRQYVKAFNRTRYAEIFQKYKEKYDGDRNAYRIYLPLLTDKKENSIEEEIKKFLTEKEYEIIDYFKGTCKFKNAKNLSKIGQVLTRFKENALMKKFVEDPERKKGDTEELMVCISRHPYDIAGSDTDRDWTNCMTMPLSPKHPRMKKLKAELKKLKPTDPKRRNIENRIQGYGQEGGNTHYLIREVEQGSLMSYLIRKDDKNINRPLAVLNIKPYMKDDQIYLNACHNSYGVQNIDFKNTVVAWLNEINADKKGIFTLNPRVYNDNDEYTIYSNIERNVEDIIKDYGYTKAQIIKITELFFNGYFVNSLKGIEKFINLKKLYCNNNKITSLDELEVCKKLTNLSCFNNKITSLKPLKNLTKLVQLNVSQNELKTLEGIEHLYKLKNLSIHLNKLTSLKGIENLNLTYLDCQSNKITSLKEVKNLVNLENLTTSNNKIESLEGIENLTKLNTFSCYGNKLTNLDDLNIKKLSNIGYFDCAYNPFDEPFSLDMFMALHLYYDDTLLSKFSTYEFQKEFLTKHPKKAENLLPIGFNPKIEKEFSSLIKKIDTDGWEDYLSNNDDEGYDDEGYDDEGYDEGEVYDGAEDDED